MRERGTRVSRGFGFLTFEFAPSAASARVYMNAAVLPGFGKDPICVDFSNRETEAQHEQVHFLQLCNPSSCLSAPPLQFCSSRICLPDF